MKSLLFVLALFTSALVFYQYSTQLDPTQPEITRTEPVKRYIIRDSEPTSAATTQRSKPQPPVLNMSLPQDWEKDMAIGESDTNQPRSKPNRELLPNLFASAPVAEQESRVSVGGQLYWEDENELAFNELRGASVEIEVKTK